MAQSATMKSLTKARADRSGDVPDELRQPAESPEVTEAEPMAGPVPGKTPATDALLAWLSAQCELSAEDTSMGLEAIIRQTLDSADPAAVLRQTLPQSGQNFTNVVMRLDGYRILPSEYEEGGGAPFYASLQVMVGEPAEPRVINCGGWRVLAQVAALASIGEWPQVIMIIEAAKAKGKKAPPLMLVSVDMNGNPAGAV